MSTRKRNWHDGIPLKIRLLLAAHSFSRTAFTGPSQTVNRPLMKIFDPKSSASKNPKRGVISSDFMVDAGRNLWFRLYSASRGGGDGDGDGNTRVPLIVYYHGGGFSFMGADSKVFDDFCQRMAREIPAVVASVNYRLAPEHKYPSQYDDGFDVLKFIDEGNFDGFPDSADLTRCFITGDSAGGNLAHHMAMRASDHEFQKLKLLGLIAIQPFFGGNERTESEIRLTEVPVISMKWTDWMWKSFLPSGLDRDHPAVNVFGPNSVDISGVKFPATVVIIGGFDPLQDWQRKYVEGLKKCGKEVHVVEYPNAFHGFYSFPELPESTLLLGEIKTFIQKQIPN